MFKIKMTKTQRSLYSSFSLCFEHLEILILNLPFDLAQGGELVEPFRISIFDIRI